MFDRVENAEKSKPDDERFDETLHRNFRAVEIPPGHSETQDVSVRDDTGRRLTLRTEDGTRQQLKAARAGDTKM